MAEDNQHFCLRWNNHQSTLISVFDTLLESGTLVDCTLAAEGQYLKAHKLVLSACSPYLELLLSQHYEKHPIVILKDVKFQELKSLMVYMYRGEVNISQDQLSTFLKAAESLQIKGLTDGGCNEDSTASSVPAKAPNHTQVRKSIQQSVTCGPSIVAQSLMIEGRPESPHIRSLDVSASPTRKRRRNQRRPSTSDDLDSHIDASNSCDVLLLQSGALSGVGVPIIPVTITKGVPLDDGDHKTDNSRINNHDASAAEGVAGPKIEPTGELIEPKPEYLEDMNNKDSIEDLTLDDGDNMDNSRDMSRAGPSYDICFNQWPMSGHQTTDEVFMNAQEAVGAHRDTQVTATRSEDGDGNEDIAKLTATIRQKSYTCKECQKQFTFKLGYDKHIAEHALGKLHQCDICQKYFKRLDTLKRHSSIHLGDENYDCLKCGKTYRYSFNLKHHMTTQHNPNFKKFKCLKCNKSFKDARYLRYHDNREHTFKTPYVCRCGSAYPAPNELYRHSKVMNH